MSAPYTTAHTALWGRDAFLGELFRRFPALEAVQDPDVHGLLHCELGWFSHQTANAIDASDFARVRDHFEFIDTAIAEASSELENAILVSYLENVFAIDTILTRRARDLLTPRLSAEVLSMSGHFIAKVGVTLAPIGRVCDVAEAAELLRRIQP